VRFSPRCVDQICYKNALGYQIIPNPLLPPRHPLAAHVAHHKAHAVEKKMHLEQHRQPA